MLGRHQVTGALEGKVVCSEPLKALQTLSIHGKQTDNSQSLVF